jgi:hypothetical protein
MERMQAFWNAHAHWSRATFGDDSKRGPIGALKHLEKEAREAQEPGHDAYEIVDCFLLTIDAARRSGMSYDEFVELAETKLEINKTRKWPIPVDDTPVEHIRD